MQREIGSNFELSYTCGEGNKQNLVDDANTVYLRSAREGLMIIAKEAIQRGINTVLLPALCCSSMAQPFEQLNLEVKYYKITDKFRIDEASLQDKLVDDSILLIMNYYGIRSYGSVSELLKNHRNVITVQDCTQHIFTENFYDNNFDFQVGSIRKWVAIPDGAFIKKLRGSLVLPEDISYVDDGYVCTNYQSMKEKTAYLECGDQSIKHAFRAKYAQCMEWLRKKVEIQSISQISRSIYTDDIDTEQVKIKRHDNYQYLVGKLSNSYPELTRHCIDQDCPLCVPIVVKKRDLLQIKLAEKGIYCQVLWPLKEEAVSKCEYSTWFATHMLAIPCDQRYSIGDMEYVAEQISICMEEL